MRIGLIGGGFMGEALVSALLKEGLAQPGEVTVSDVAEARRQHLVSRYSIVATAKNAEAAQDAGLLVLAVKPQEFPTVASDLRGKLDGGQTVLTIMAGVPSERVVEALGHEAVVRAMPNTAAFVGQAMSVWIATEAVSDEGRDVVARLLRALGREVRVTDEKYLDMATAVSGSGPGFVFLFLEAFIDAAVHIGLRRELAQELAQKDLAAAVLTLPDSIAWLLNLRGGDVPRAPLPLSFALLRADGSVDWFVAPEKLGPELEAHLGDGVGPREPNALGPALDQLGREGVRVLADPDSAAAWVFARLRAAGAEVVAGVDPCQLPKARKNAVELDGARAAHRRDGLALTRFLAWLDREAPARRPGEELGEVEVAERLRAFRTEDSLFRDLSFDTIAGAGANGAIVHYHARAESQGRLRKGELLLLDSGAQYSDGTTDVTRTIAIGEPSAEMRERFTRVLKGHIALATARFPRGTSGSQLDVLARYHLWQAGLDYDHGTGHGVGSYLGVHEGPQRISKLPNRVALEPGMIVSNEPGYYKAGAYGIRIENLVAVVESEVREEGWAGEGGEGGDGEGRNMLAFETLTLAPIDRNLIDVAILSPEETAWLDAYHARVRAAHHDRLDPETAQWLDAATRPLRD